MYDQGINIILKPEWIFSYDNTYKLNTSCKKEECVIANPQVITNIPTGQLSSKGEHTLTFLTGQILLLSQ